MIMSFEEYYNSAREQLTKPHEDYPHGVLLGETQDFSLQHLLVASKHRAITPLDIKHDYLRQLVSLVGKVAPEQIIHAHNTVLMSKVKISMEDILSASSDELTLVLQNKEVLSSILSDRLMGEHGLLGAIAIKLQAPNATQLLTLAQAKKLGIAIRDNQQPIVLLTPARQTYIEVEGKQKLLSAATNAEKLAVAGGKLPIQSKLKYMLKSYYDIEQLKLSKHDLLRIEQLVAPKEISWEAITRFVSQIQNDDGLTLRVVDVQPSKMAERSLFDPSNNTIYLKSMMSDQQRAWELTKRMCEAVTTATSHSPAVVQQFEYRLMATQLANKWSVSPSTSIVAETVTAFSQAQSSFTVPIAETVATTNRAVHFVSQQLAGVLEVEHQAETAHTPAHQQAATQAQGEQLSNFIEGIQ